MSVAVTLALLGALLPRNSWSLGSAPGDIAAYLSGVFGQVEIRQGTEAAGAVSGDQTWTPGEKGLALGIDGRIRIRKGRAALTFADYDEVNQKGPTVINLGENTEMAIRDFSVSFEKQQGPKGIFELIRGKIRNFLSGYGQSPDFSVRAGVAVCSLHGAEAELEFEPESGRLLVHGLTGKTVVTSPFGSWIVERDELLVLEDGKASRGPS